jgi:hypothetical protein
MSHQAGQSPASFYSSPQEALQAPPEELVGHELALLELGQPVLSGAALLAPEGELPSGGRDGGRPRLLRRFPDGPARAHEVRLQGGDCTTEIFQ